jgi:hypothetical protein
MKPGLGTTRINLKHDETKVSSVHQQNIISIELIMIPEPYDLQQYVYNTEAFFVINKLFWELPLTTMACQTN